MIDPSYDLTQTVELFQPDGVKEANRYLQAGWVLVATHTASIGVPAVIT